VEVIFKVTGSAANRAGRGVAELEQYFGTGGLGDIYSGIAQNGVGTVYGAAAGESSCESSSDW
jgi:hypothetical protein